MSCSNKYPPYYMFHTDNSISTSKHLIKVLFEPPFKWQISQFPGHGIDSLFKFYFRTLILQSKIYCFSKSTYQWYESGYVDINCSSWIQPNFNVSFTKNHQFWLIIVRGFETSSITLSISAAHKLCHIHFN